MNRQEINPDDRTRKWLNESGLERPSDDFTQRVMAQVEVRKKIYPYKRDSNLWQILLAVVLPVAYFVYRYATGASILPGGISLQQEVQPYVHVFQLLLERITLDFSTPIVPLGIIAIVALLAFDRLILRSLSLKG